MVIGSVRAALLAFATWLLALGSATAAPGPDYQRARQDALHFKPQIDQASDAQCLACHAEVLKPTVRSTSPAGVQAATAKAWYQQTSTYAGEQDTFHRRHLVTPMAQQLMQLRCNTCHQGHDPRDENPLSSATAQRQGGFTLRKMVVTEATCLKCHGQMNTAVMGLPEPWPKSKALFQDNCLLCHAAIRTNRHQVNYLQADAIEQAGAKGSDTCYGCHGGRAWYRINYPYTRTPWEGMSTEAPDWAKHRPTAPEARFRLTPTSSSKIQTGTQP
jgi:nitrate/TMAO reductase-like tetraheme cytochrome c subunit